MCTGGRAARPFDLRARSTRAPSAITAWTITKVQSSTSPEKTRRGGEQASLEGSRAHLNVAVGLGPPPPTSSSEDCEGRMVRCWICAPPSTAVRRLSQTASDDRDAWMEFHDRRKRTTRTTYSEKEMLAPASGRSSSLSAATPISPPSPSPPSQAGPASTSAPAIASCSDLAGRPRRGRGRRRRWRSLTASARTVLCRQENGHC